MKIPERGICIATRYRTVAELVERMHPYCDEQSLFVATNQLRATGTRAKFALQLADRTVALIGWCEVMQAWPTADNRYRRPGVQFALQRLTPASQLVFDQLIAARLTSHRNAGRAWRRRPTSPTRPSRLARSDVPSRAELVVRSMDPTQPEDAARTDRFERVAPCPDRPARSERSISVTRQDRAARPTSPMRPTRADRSSDAIRRAAPTERMVPLEPAPPDAPLGGVALPLPAPPELGIPSLDAALSALLADAAQDPPAPPPRAPSGTSDLSAPAAAAVLDADALIPTSPRVRWSVVAITALTILSITAGVGLGLLH